MRAKGVAGDQIARVHADVRIVGRVTPTAVIVGDAAVGGCEAADDALPGAGGAAPVVKDDDQRALLLSLTLADGELDAIEGKFANGLAQYTGTVMNLIVRR